MKRWLLFGSAAAALFAVAILVSATVHLLALELPSRGLDYASRGPSRIYSRPLALRVGAQLSAAALADHLAGGAYRRVEGRPERAGEYARKGRRFEIATRRFF